MKIIRRLAFHKGLWLFVLSSLLLIVYANLGAAMMFAVPQGNSILYPFYTRGFRALFIVLYLALWIFSTIRYVITRTPGNIWGKLLLSFATAVGIIYSYGFWWIAFIVGCIAYFYIAKKYRNVWGGFVLILTGFFLPVCPLVIFVLPNNPLIDLYQDDTTQLDGRIYNLASHIVIEERSFGVQHSLYRCDSWGIVCNRIYDKQEWWGVPSHLETDPSAHTVSLVLDDKVIYTYYAGE